MRVELIIRIGADHLICLLVILICCGIAQAQNRSYTIQVASVETEQEARHLVEKLGIKSLEAYWLKAAVPGKGIRYRVRIGRFASQPDALKRGEQLREKGFINNFIITLYERAESFASEVSGRMNQGEVTSIRHIDFMNFTYPLSTDDAQIFHKRTIAVNKGKFDNKKNSPDWLALSVIGIIYGDITGDGQEDAIISTISEWSGANPANSVSHGFYLYTLKNGKAFLLATPDAINLWRDYTPYVNQNDECDGWIWDSNARHVQSMVLAMELKVGGRHCVDKGYDVIMKYRWNGQKFVLLGTPQKRRSR